MIVSRESYDVIVVGGGHAGIEAALAPARLGKKTLLITMQINAIGKASCNPAIGGLAKGHLVREIDALGGEMAKATDATGIQFKMLNRSKGRAVWSPRAQIDKHAYSAYMADVCQSQSGLDLYEGEAVAVTTDPGGHVAGVKTASGENFAAKTLILTNGTFLNGLIHIGNKNFSAGRIGESASIGITESLVALGFKTGRLKTGTPPRIKRSSVDLSKTTLQMGDANPEPFSYSTGSTFDPPNQACYITKTNTDTHEIIAGALDTSPLFTGVIQGVGPRYCPSIEDKVVRFSDKPSHQLFLEPEWTDSEQLYVNGYSSSLPEEVQLASLRTVSGLENVEFIRPGYAIEYDFFPPSQLKASLETKTVKGLFFAGQINGTSGYEEAAAQGLIAGINASRLIDGHDPFVLGRDEAYIGVLIDDLITKESDEPYRMFTSRAEHRLLLRYDNAHFRLSARGHEVGLVGEDQHADVFMRMGLAEQAERFFEKTFFKAEDLSHLSSSQPMGKENQSLANLLRRPGIDISDLYSLLPDWIQAFDRPLLDLVATNSKYKGYIERERLQVERLSRYQSMPIPTEIDYLGMNAISFEARQKLDRIRPETIGQASRISGVSPADVSILLILVRKFVSRETT